MELTIELDREGDGRWIADIPQLNILLYGGSREDAVRKAKTAACEIIADRIARGELPAEAADAVFAVAARASGRLPKHAEYSRRCNASAGIMTEPSDRIAF
jgi:hypothetical protein